MSRKGRTTGTSSRDSHLTLMGLIDKEWQVRHTSLVLNRNEDEDNGLAETASKAISCALPKMSQFTLSLTRCPAIQLNDRTHPALLVELFIDGATLFIGYFINWSSWADDDYDDCYRLPIYLFSGKADVAKAVNKALMKTFDFVMSSVQLNPAQMAKLLAIFIRFADETEDRKCAVLKYTIRNMPKSNCISVTNTVKSLFVVLKFMVEENPNDDDLSLIFYEKLLKHYRTTYQLNLAQAVLRQISLPDAMATNTGHIRMCKEDVLSASLTLLDSFFPLHQPPARAMSVPSNSSSCS